MEKWHTRFKLRFKKIRSRFLAAMIVLSIPPLALVGYISYNITKETLLDTNTQTTTACLRNSIHQGKPLI